MIPLYYVDTPVRLDSSLIDLDRMAWPDINPTLAKPYHQHLQQKLFILYIQYIP
jgi:hypothetical protein